MKAAISVIKVLRHSVLLILLLSSCVLLSGCWDSKDLGDEAFVTGIGIDYANGEFIVSLQLLDFAAIAKTEGDSHGPANVWVGKGSGKSVHETIMNVAQSAQIEINLEQLKVVVVREPAMKKMDEILDALNRVRVSRYTSWIFGTRGEIEDVFAANTFFERSQLSSMLYNPKIMYKQSPAFKPVIMQQFVSDYNENAETALLPSVTINKKAWRQRKSMMEMEEVEGVFAFKLKEQPVFLPLPEIDGFRWVVEHFGRKVITVANGDKGRAAVTIRSSKVKRRIRMKNGQPALSLHIRANGSLSELHGQIGRAEIVALVKKQIEQEVKRAYEAGAAKGVDLFSAEETLYRHHLNTWRTWKKRNWKPGAGNLEIRVTFNLKYSGVFELK